MKGVKVVMMGSREDRRGERERKKLCPMWDLTMSIDNALVTSVPTAENLDVVLDSQLSFEAQTA